MEEQKRILHSEEDRSQFLDLLFLKSVTEWLEKQNWISSPYGGDNYLEDLIFRIKLLSGREWSSIFQDGKAPFTLEEMKEYFEMLKTIDPCIKNFYDGVHKNPSELRQSYSPELKSP